MDDCLVIPSNWRKNILGTLHSPHQWVSSIKSRANAAVYWPGINNNIRNVWYSCHFYNEIAPHQPKESIILTPIPQYPFQQICADYFEMSGHNHLSIVGRFSGWLNIYHYPPHKTIADPLSVHVVLCLSATESLKNWAIYVNCVPKFSYKMGSDT